MKNLLVSCFISICLVFLGGCETDALAKECEDCGNSGASDNCCPVESEKSDADKKNEKSSDCSGCCP